MLKGARTTGTYVNAVWYSAARKTLANLNKRFPPFATFDYEIPADKRAPAREFFFSHFLGASTRSELSKFLKEYDERPVSRQWGDRGYVGDNEICLTVPLHEDLGRYCGLFLRGENGGEWIMTREAAPEPKGLIMPRACCAYRSIYGFDSLIKDGSVLSIAGRKYAIEFHP